MGYPLLRGHLEIRVANLFEPNVINANFALKDCNFVVKRGLIPRSVHCKVCTVSSNFLNAHSTPYLDKIVNRSCCFRLNLQGNNKSFYFK